MLLVAEDQEGVGGNDQDPVVGCGCSAVLVKKLGAARRGGITRTLHYESLRDESVDAAECRA